MCPGYQNETDLLFRHYSEKGDELPLTQPSKGIPTFQNSCHTPSLGRSLPFGVSYNATEQYALALFLDDFSVVSRDRLVSRGYLHDLKSLLANAGPLSDVAKAARVAALASLGNKAGRPDIVRRASLMYSDLLSSFPVTMSDPSTSNTIKSLATAVLLGLYEVWLEWSWI